MNGIRETADGMSVQTAAKHMSPEEWEVRVDLAVAFCLVDLEDNVLSETDYGIKPAGFTIRSAVHAARPEAGCVMHTHAPAGVGVATQKDGLLPLTQHALAVIGHTCYHDYVGFAMDPNERSRPTKSPPRSSRTWRRRSSNSAASPRSWGRRSDLFAS